MKRETEDCTYRARCKIHLVEEQKYKITCGVARMTKTGSRQSGDSYSFMEMKNGQCLLALSDGMGSGARAREESAAAVELLEDFIDSGFDKETAVKMINSVLVLKSTEETFSTLDICSIDLYTGNAEFIKIGASLSYVLSDGALRTIKSSSLPIGMLNTVDLEVHTKKLRDDDFIIMLTDGLTEVDDTRADKGAWLAEAIANFRGKNPQDIADHLITEAKSLSGERIKDDMTVLVAKIWQKV